MLTPEKIAAIREFEVMEAKGRMMGPVKSSLPSHRRFEARRRAVEQKCRDLGVTQDDIREAANG